jgi:hypothetical protein
MGRMGAMHGGRPAGPATPGAAPAGQNVIDVQASSRVLDDDDKINRAG